MKRKGRRSQNFSRSLLLFTFALTLISGSAKANDLEDAFDHVRDFFIRNPPPNIHIQPPVNTTTVNPIKSFRYQAASWTIARRVVAKVEFHCGSCFPASALS